MGRRGRAASSRTAVAAAASAVVVCLLVPPDGPQALAAPAVVAPVEPVVAAHVRVDNYRNARFTGVWSVPDGAEAVLCYSPGGPPASPEAAQACSEPDPYLGSLVGVSPRSTVDPPEPLEHFAVFARSAPTGPWGPPALDQGGAPPPFPAAALRTTGRSATVLVLAWEDASPTYGSDYTGRGGTTRWVVAWAPGRRSPEELAGAGVTSLTRDALDHSARISGLDRGRLYTFQVRGRDADGHLSDWSDPVTATARRPGLLVVQGRPGGRDWQRSWVPRSRRAEAGSAAVGARGRVHVVASTGAFERYALLEHGRWTVRRAESGDQGLTSSPAGVLAAARLRCISVKRPGRPWRHAWCAGDRADISGPVLDDRSKVHAFVETPDGVSYLTNRTGRWTTRDLATGPLPSIVYDAVADRIVALRPVAGDVSAVRVSSKRPAADRFGHAWTWKLGPEARAVSAAASAGRLTVVAGGEDGLLVGTASTDGRRHVVRRVGRGYAARPLVASSSARSVALAWTTRRGVMTGSLRWSGGRWELSGVRRRTGVRHDTALDLDVGADDRLVVLVHRPA